jgi:hypothetical protein
LNKFAIRVWRNSNAAMGWLPLSIVGLPATLLGIKKINEAQRRLAAYGSGAPVVAGGRGWFSALLYNLCGLPLGALAVFTWLLAVPNTVRCVLLYGLTDGGSADTAWGGPTLAGAWVVHAILALALVPVYLALFAGLGWLQRALATRLLGRGGSAHVIGAAGVVSLGAAVFFVAFLHQL